MALTEHVDEWSRALRTAGRSPATVANYTAGVRLFAAWAAEHAPEVTEVRDVEPTHVRSWLASLMESGAASKTVGARYQAVRAHWTWLDAEGEADASAVLRVQRPSVREPEIHVPSKDELRAVLATCADRKVFGNVRDEAAIRLWLDVGLRRSELAGLTVEDVDQVAQTVSVMGKGSKPRTVVYGSRTSLALDRYLRVRRRHPHAALSALWLGDRGRGPITGASLYRMLVRRAERAGVELYPHQLRHFFADGWLKAGGSEGGLMRAAGWSSRQMLDRYASANAAERSRAERRGLSIGDDL